MKQFLFSSVVFNKTRYTLLRYGDDVDIVQKLDYLLKHRTNPVIWPLFVKADIDECLCMDKSIPSLLKGLVVSSVKCSMRYNGGIYQIDEIVPSTMLDGYWSVRTNLGMCEFDPTNIELL